MRFFRFETNKKSYALLKQKHKSITNNKLFTIYLLSHINYNMIRRRVALSCANIDHFVGHDAAFMNNISIALKNIHESFGYKGVQECMKVTADGKEGDVDLDVLCKMLGKSREKIESECCTMFFASKSIHGSFMYLFGSLIFGAVAYFQDMPNTYKAIGAFLGSTFYLLGGLLFIIAAIEPYWKKTLEINRLSKDVGTLKQKSNIVKCMSGRNRSSTNTIKARMSKLNINAKTFLSPSEISAIGKIVEESDEESENSFEMVNNTTMTNNTHEINMEFTDICSESTGYSKDLIVNKANANSSSSKKYEA